MRIARKLAAMIKNKIIRLVFRIISVFLPIKNQIVFESYNGKQYSDNPRAISEKMHQLFPQYSIVWHINKSTDKSCVPEYVKIVDSRKKYYFEVLKSFCVVRNEEYSPIYIKRKEQFFIQTWHGDKPFKKILYDSSNNKKEFLDALIVDLAISGSEFGTKLYRSAFRYKGKVLQIGNPRTEMAKERDVAFKQALKKKIGLSNDTKIVLYAPTFRDNTAKQQINVNLEEVLDLLNKKNKTKYACLIRGHVGKRLDSPYGFIDVTFGYDMADLLSISDLLITDYSSVAADASSLGIDVIITAFDQDEYLEKCREFYYSPKECGFIVSCSQRELNILINNYDTIDFSSSRRKVEAFFGIIETGHSSEKICEIVNDFKSTGLRND